MDPQTFKAVREIVADALELPADERTPLVRARAAHNSDILEAALALLHEHDTNADPLSEALLAQRRAKLESSLAAHDPDEPATIGGYRVIRRIGEGGMGVVYEAEQQQPQRRVAIKVVDSLRMVPEFEQRLRLESEVQGRLLHPGIAQVFEAGVAHSGRSRRPFFAMELVNGRPLNTFAEDASLSRRDRLELIARVADAIGYAHARGVIHRDLKPDNVLVTPDGQPKVLDFGIARLTGDATLAATAMTREGQILGTLAYMAPEQLSTSEADVSPAADVYALGVVLFELLAGRLPVELGGLSISAAVRIIEFADPPQLKSLDASVPAEVGVIVGKCLNRDPERRYADGAALASDIRRFLDGRPILAKPLTHAYRVRKFVSRNKALVGGTAATIATLTAGLIAAAILAHGQYQARLAAQTSDREARRQQAKLSSQTFQTAADLAIEGRVLESIESLEAIPPDLRGWGWDLLAASVPAWMPGNHSFGGLAFNTDAGTAWTGNRRFAVVDGDNQVLTIIDGTLVTWDPITGGMSHHNDLGRVSRVEQIRHVSLPNIIAYGASTEASVLDTRDWSVERAPDLGQQSATASRYEPASGAWMWMENADGGDSTPGDGSKAFIATESHGTKSIDLGTDADTDIPGWVDVRNLDERAVVSLYRESEPPHWFRFAVIDTASGEITARTDRVPGSMSFVLLNTRNEIAAASMTYPDREPAGGVVFFDAATLEIKRRFDDIAQPLAYLPDRDRLIVRLEDGTYRLIDPDAGQLDDALLLEDGSPYPIIASNGVMHGGASIVAITPRPYRPLVIDTTDPQIGLRPLYHARPLPGAAYNLAISPSGGLLATMSPWHDEVTLLDARTGEMLALLPVHSNQRHRWFATLWFSPDGQELLASVEAEDGSVVGVTRWNLRDGTSSMTWPDNSAPINSIVPPLDTSSLPSGGQIGSRHVVTPKRDALLFTGSGENTIKRLDLATQTLDTLPIGTAEGVALSPDGRHLAAVATLGARIIDIETGEVIARPISDPDRLLCAAYSPDGSTLAVGSQDGRIFVIETEFHTLLYTFNATPPGDGRGPLFVYGLRWSPDSKTLYAAHSWGVLTAWDARHPRERREQRGLWQRADQTAARLVDESGVGGAAKDSGTLLGNPSLSPEERAAAEVALIRRWPSAEEE